MNQEQVTAENTEEKAAEVTASSEMAGQTQEAVRRRENGSAAVSTEARMSPSAFWTGPDRCFDRCDCGNDHFLRGTRWI